ncbi:MAG TPA: DUF2934 domain-containing protein [Nitrospira sp.]|nr:DUF2934 domain-containing protein [Nitrospira sp.]
MKLSAKPQKFRAASTSRNVGTASAAASDSSDTGPSNGVHTRIAVLAYQLYEQRGREDGHDVEDWIRAEQSVLAANPVGSMGPRS